MSTFEEEIPIVETYKGSIMFYGDEHHCSPYYTTTDPVRAIVLPLFESGAVTYRTMEHVQKTGIIVSEHTETMKKIYVNSVRNATEAEDEGDGTAENPFTCLNTAINRYCKQTCAYASEKFYGCVPPGDSYESWQIVSVQIVLTGIVNYPVFIAEQYEEGLCDTIKRIVITGNGQTEIYLTRTGYEWPINATDPLNELNFQNCKIIFQGYESANAHQFLATFDNCDITFIPWAKQVWNYTPYLYKAYKCSIHDKIVYGNTFSMIYDCVWYMEPENNSYSGMRIICMDSCTNFIRIPSPITSRDFRADYMYRSSMSMTNVGISTVIYADSVNINAQAQNMGSSLAFGVWYEIHNSTISITGWRVGISEIGQMYNSTINIHSKFYDIESNESGPVGGAIPWETVTACPSIAEDSLISITLDFSDAELYDEEDANRGQWVAFLYADGAAFYNMTVQGTIIPPTNISPGQQYRAQLCWAYSAQNFVHEGGGSFSRIVSTNGPEAIPCPVDPY